MSKSSQGEEVTGDRRWEGGPYFHYNIIWQCNNLTGLLQLTSFYVVCITYSLFVLHSLLLAFTCVLLLSYIAFSFWNSNFPEGPPNKGSINKLQLQIWIGIILQSAINDPALGANTPVV